MVHTRITGQSVNYRISLDNFPNLVEGIVSVRKEEKGIVLDWRHLNPCLDEGLLLPVYHSAQLDRRV